MIQFDRVLDFESNGDIVDTLASLWRIEILRFVQHLQGTQNFFSPPNGARESKIPLFDSELRTPTLFHFTITLKRF